MTIPILKKILYVEDEPDIHLIAQIALEEMGGLNVQFCLTGKEALDVAEKFKPDLFLLDVMLPDMDGPATLNALHQIPSLSHIPAIFLTARVQDKEVAEYKKLGIISVIKKPFDPITLAQTIQTAWSNYYEERNGHSEN